MRPRSISLIASAAVIAVALALAACPGQDDKHDDLAGYRAQLRVGYAIEPPYSFLSETGEVTGEGPEIVRHVAARLELDNVRWILMGFGSLIDELRDGRIDVVGTPMFITPERTSLVRFSVPVSQVGQGLLVLGGNPKKLHSYEDAAAHADAVVAVLAGAVEKGILQDQGLPADRVFVAQDVETALSALRHGRVDGLALTSPTVNHLASRSNGLFEAATPFTGPVVDGTTYFGLSALVFRPHDEALARAFNAVLTEFIGSQEHREIVQSLGFGPETIPPHPATPRPPARESVPK
ncbi:ABC-type transporter, periplasmic subunit family 3 [Alkalidesulfovibrio alkalitolerans DSM 16529]|jgi:polar amino acid transport system substrate-binding protein|uniref:ABC-type transporter, periplasmic subunit family 3 n=1 Tax=Alkalidesulfovibrio alkalitolerans DSM 16529 TaxID=1121439 RepID=S7UC83_9BACT|nr:ABC-type transporter, periplasmic subunit family 3 [Alkalidesulfovibrio alkalitolerans DSM 16529]